ncbi:MAG: hypothetical protein ACO2PN_12030 [Pyrobaculum sp.]
MPAVDEVLERISRRGVLHGAVDWVFQASAIYTEYKVRNRKKLPGVCALSRPVDAR